MIGLLLNENLPIRLTVALRQAGIEAKHVSDLGLNGCADLKVWSQSIQERLAVITKDSDYLDLVPASGEGQVVLVTVGNLRLNELIDHVVAKAELIAAFLRLRFQSARALGSQTRLAPMITLRVVEIGLGELPAYASVSTCFQITSRISLGALRSSGGNELREEPIEPSWKDYDALEPVTSLPSRWNLAHWGIFAAFDDDTRLGGAIVARDTQGLEFT
ncbi:MAG: DUF5615 family PIN-like protein [Fimbriimonas ginsengisoli]|uniref:DUF5615 family PIN-like protein n=1 Tax=Fimbriimonas ginsengisoli TaxID=1005039 RepID=A0A931M009_FIMGI|nr:DUF5615 family PIN-like protein [Fimbriimonas ginsengisoli]